MHSREMYNFEADPERFPNGLAAAVKDIKEQYGMKVGMISGEDKNFKLTTPSDMDRMKLCLARTE